VPGDVPGDFAAAGGVADVDGIPQIERMDQRGEIVGVGVQVIAAPRLAGPAVATSVVRNHTISALRQEQHLVVPGVGAQRPAVAEDDGSSGAPILEVDLAPILRRDGIRHEVDSFPRYTFESMAGGLVSPPSLRSL
jgi:hypothetical protein